MKTKREMSSSWATDYFAPAIGTVIANIMWITPVMAVREARKRGTLGELIVLLLMI